jgi:long-chain fatty acid transport protein
MKKRRKQFRVNYTTAIFIIQMLIILSMDTAGSELHQEDGIMTNHSAEYVRTLNRNTSTDPDAAFYNPAGLAFMTQNGLHISFSSQTYYVKRTHSMDFYGLQKLNTESIPVSPPHKKPDFNNCLAEEYPAELTAPVVPGVDIVWKQENLALFFNIAVMQAATDMTYPDGLAVMDWGNLLSKETEFDPTYKLIQYTRNAEAVRNEMYIGLTAGGAYRLANWISTGGGLRFIHAEGNMKVGINNINFVVDQGSGPVLESIPATENRWDIDTDTSGFGTGLILSTHFRAEPIISMLKGLEATFRFEYYPPMEIEKKTNKFIAPSLIEKSGNLNIFKDGTPGKEMTYDKGNGDKTLKVTYPSTLNFGLSYMLFDWLNLLSSAQLSFRKNRDLGGREKDYTTGYQAGGGAEFILSPKVTLSIGYLFNDFGIKPDKRTEADPLLNSHQIGGGALFHVDDQIDLNIGAFYQIFIPATAYTTEYVNVSQPTLSYLRKDYDEKRYSIAIGITYRITDKSKPEETKNNTEDNKPAKGKTGNKKNTRPKKLNT